MRYSYKLTSSVVGPGVNIHRNDANAFKEALARARTNNNYKKEIKALVDKLDVKIERAIISAFGGGRVSAGKPIITPTFTTTLDITRDSGTNKITSINRGIVSRVSLKNPIRIENIETSSGDVYEYNDALVSFIRTNSSNSATLFKRLSTDKLTTRLVTNFSEIGITYKQSNRTIERKITFNLSDVSRAISAGKAKVRVKETTNSIEIDIYFTEAVFAKATAAANSVVQRELNGDLGRRMAKIIADQTVIASKAVMSDVRVFLGSLNVSYILKYLPGGAVNRTNIILKSIADDSVQYQSFISALQWTALVQARLGDTMQRTGEPEPPDLKERTGRFRSSVNVVPNYRANLIRYTYLPLYSSLKKYGYEPDLQIRSAIEAVEQQQFPSKRASFASRFNIVRG